MDKKKTVKRKRNTKEELVEKQEIDTTKRRKTIRSSIDETGFNNTSVASLNEETANSCGNEAKLRKSLIVKIESKNSACDTKEIKVMVTKLDVEKLNKTTIRNSVLETKKSLEENETEKCTQKWDISDNKIVKNIVASKVSENCPSELSALSNFRNLSTQDNIEPKVETVTLINEDTCSSNSQSIQENSDEESSKTPRRRLPKKSEKNNRSGLKKRPKPNERIVTTQKLKTDELNRIQITMVTTEKANETKTIKKRADLLKNYIGAGKMTYRVMKRANFVIETVRQEKVIVDLTKLMKLIREDELGEGYKAAIDKKSLMRLILKLSRDGYIKFRKATLKSDSKEKCVCFICDPNIEDDHSVITSALEQSKMKFFIGTKDAKSKEESMLIEEKDLPKDSMNIVKFIDLPQVEEVKISYKYDRNASKTYGLCPKFVRTRIMHELLFYLIYIDNTQIPIKERDEIDKVFQEFDVEEDVFVNDQLSPIYKKEVGWKMFIPPLPVHDSWPRGWSLICDILLRLPLTIFLKCFNVPYVIPDVDFYMNHPIRKFYLVKNLPPKIRNGLMHGRKYIFAMHEIISRLCHMGLVQFGPQKLKEKDQVFIYLNKRASLFNTVTSPPGYHQIAEMDYEKREHYFRSFQDVETYWYELWTICINTNLGTRNSVTGQYIVLEQAHTKPVLLEATKPHTVDEVESYDKGVIPGDCRGAGGLDSALFAHLKRNWNWADLLTYQEKKVVPVPQEIRLPEESEVKKPKVESKKVKQECKVKKVKVKIRGGARKKIIRHVLPARQKIKKPMYDEKDKICLKKMSKLRTDWTQIEDNVLLLCKVSSIYLCPNRRRQNVEYTIMRDVLHKMVPYTNDKTSRSCQRRISYIMKNVKTRRSVHMCLEEIRQDEFVSEKFASITKKYQGMIIPTLTLNIAFVELVGYMNRKFSNLIPTASKPLAELPDTIEEIKRVYEVNVNQRKSLNVFKDVENVQDINFDVVRSVIHSSMCCSKDKTSWAFQLFKIYQQYPEGLLRSVISKLRHDQMVSIKKAFVKTAIPTGCLPFSSPFQLSISYAYQLQNTRFNYDSYNEANSFLRNLVTWSKNRVDKITKDYLDITMSDTGTSMIILDVLDKFKVEFKFEHPEQVIVLDPVITNDSAYERIVKRYNEILKDPTRISYWEESKQEDEEENFPDLEEVKSVDLNSSLIRRSSTRIAFHMMRAEMCDGVDKSSAQHIHDYFVVNASRIFLNMPAETNFCMYDVNYLQNEIKAITVLEKLKFDAFVPDSCGRITTDEIKNYFGKQIENNDLEFIEKIKCFIQLKEELGATIDDLKNISPDSPNVLLDLKQILNMLNSLKMIFRVGTILTRFVHYDYISPWIVNADKIVRLEKEKIDPKEVPSNKWKGKNLIKNLPTVADEQKIKLLIAPWIRLDGSLNRRVLDRWMGAVISYIMEEPGINLHDVTVRFDYLKPVEVIYLIEILEMLKCVSLIKINKPKVTLFSKEPDLEVVEATILDEPKLVLIEPSSDIIYKFSVFMGHKNYGANFID